MFLSTHALPIHPVYTTHPPSPRGVQHYEPNALPRLASRAAHPVEKMHTATVNSNDSLYKAILSYAALFQASPTPVTTSQSISDKQQHHSHNDAIHSDHTQKDVDLSHGQTQSPLVNPTHFHYQDKCPATSEGTNLPTKSRTLDYRSLPRDMRRMAKAAISSSPMVHAFNSSVNPRRPIPGAGPQPTPKRKWHPNFTMGLGDAAVPWPPPQHLKARAIVESFVAVYKHDKHAINVPVPGSFAMHHALLWPAERVCPENVDGDNEGVSSAVERSEQAETAEKDDNHTNVCSQVEKRDISFDQTTSNINVSTDHSASQTRCDSSDAEDDDDSVSTFLKNSTGMPRIFSEDILSIHTSTTIYLSHYSVGTFDDEENEAPFLEILLATPDHPCTLYHFCKGVLSWHTEVTRASAPLHSFPLYRLHVAFGHATWKMEGLKPARLPQSVILLHGLMRDILNDAREFRSKETREWYKLHSIPQRRAYLFHGSPGTGKTSTVRVLATELKLNACFVQFASAGMSNQTLANALRTIPQNALLVLEDVDALFNEDRDAKMTGQLTFSGLLNALDGLVSAEGGVLTVMTTNHVHKLDQALIRGGRVDRRFHFGEVTKGMLVRYFLSFYPDADKAIAEQFTDAVWCRKEGLRARKLSTLQQVFIAYRREGAEACANGVDAFLDAFFKMDGQGKDGKSMYV